MQFVAAGRISFVRISHGFDPAAGEGIVQQGTGAVGLLILDIK
jgi:hypothetical protein